MKFITLRMAAGLVAVLGIVAIPVLFIGLEGWRKSAIIPVIYISWKFGVYAFKA